MSDELLYNLTVSVENGANIDQVEDKLEELLFDLYDLETVDAITVKDRTPPIDEDMDEMLEVIDNLESEEIRRAIDLVLKMEDVGDE